MEGAQHLIESDEKELSYREIFVMADAARKENDHETALNLYKQALDFIYKDENLSDFEYKYRECACRDMIIVCQTQLQRKPSDVLPNMQEYADIINQIFETDFNILVDTPLKARSVVELERFFEFIKDFSSRNLDEYNKPELLWFLYYFIARWAFVVRIYYTDCTTQFELAKKCEELCEYSAKRAIYWREKVSESKLQNQLFQKLDNLQKWLNFYPQIQNALTAILQGDHEQASEKLSFIEDKVSQDDIISKEYIQELRGKRLYEQICINPGNYNNLMEQFEVLYKQCVEIFPRVALKIKLLQIRAALRYGDLENAERSFNLVKNLSSSNQKEHSHISMRWLNLIEVQIALLRYKKGIIKSIFDEIRKGIDDISPGIVFEDLALDRLQIRNQGTSQRLSRPEVLFAPLEVERLIVLASIEFEYISRKYDHQRFERACAYLLNAFNILKEIEYKDKYLFDLIEKTYKALVRVNYLETKLKHEEIEAILDSLNMEDIARHHQLEEWVIALAEIIKEKKISNSDPCEDELSGTLLENLRRFSPIISKVSLKTDFPDDFVNFVQDKKHASIFEYAGNPSLNSPEENFITILKLNTGRNHILIIKSAHSLPKHIKDLLVLIADGLSCVLKIHYIYVGAADNLTEGDKKLLYLYSSRFTEVLLQKDMGTIEHLRRMRILGFEFGKLWNQKYPDHNIDLEKLEFMISHHDIGKWKLPVFVLAKPTRPHKEESKLIEDHSENGAEILYGLLGFDEITQIALTHHIQEGLQYGYPIDLKGIDYIKFIKKWISENIEYLDFEERQFLKTNACTFEEKLYKDFILFLDIIEAVTSNFRSYRKPMSFKELAGFMNSKIGVNFPHYIVYFALSLMRNGEGEINSLLSHGEIEDGVLHNDIELPVSYLLDNLYAYLQTIKDRYADEYFLDYEESIKGLKDHLSKGIAMSKNCIRAAMFDLYIRSYGFSKIETEERYGDLMDKFISDFINWTREKGIQPVPDLYGLDFYEVIK
jgi:HD-GYP domain-containing protein (c-di-GMP phosphodiesterase class II)